MNKTNALSFFIPRPNSEAHIRLFCFPYAGGQASAFMPWLDHFDSEIELVFVQYPGRGNRSNEPLCDNIKILTDLLLQDFIKLPKDDNKATIFYGHSFGSRVAFEVAHALVASGFNSPSHFIVSAGKAPHAQPPHNETLEMSDKDLKSKLFKLGGAFSNARQHADILELHLPIIRADFIANDGYFRAPDKPLSCSATILVGQQDQAVPLETIQLWQEHFAKEVKFILYDGGHFFIDSHQNEVLGDIQEIVNDLIPEF